MDNKGPNYETVQTWVKQKETLSKLLCPKDYTEVGAFVRAPRWAFHRVKSVMVTTVTKKGIRVRVSLSSRRDLS